MDGTDDRVPCEDFASCGVAQFQNRQFAKNAKQQDSYFVVEDLGAAFGTNLGGAQRLALYGVADGHGEFGELSANFVRRNLPPQLAQSPHLARGRLEQALLEAFAQTELLQQSAGLPLWASGACVCVVAVSATHIVVANCGDCRCVLADQGTAQDLSNDHNVDNGSPEELQRVVDSGGTITPDRRVTVAGAPGRLQTTRSMGDYWAKPQGPPERHVVPATPELRTVARQPGQQYLVLASDGIFGFMSSQDAVTLCIATSAQVTSNSPLSRISHTVVSAAVKRRSDDNCTCLVVDLSRVEVKDPTASPPALPASPCLPFSSLPKGGTPTGSPLGARPAACGHLAPPAGLGPRFGEGLDPPGVQPPALMPGRGYPPVLPPFDAAVDRRGRCFEPLPPGRPQECLGIGGRCEPGAVTPPHRHPGRSGASFEPLAVSPPSPPSFSPGGATAMSRWEEDRPLADAQLGATSSPLAGRWEDDFSPASDVSSLLAPEEMNWCPWCWRQSDDGDSENVLLGSLDQWRQHMHHQHFDKLGGVVYGSEEVVPCHWCCRPCVTEQGQHKSMNRLPFWGSHERVCRENPNKPGLPGQETRMGRGGSRSGSGESVAGIPEQRAGAARWRPHASGGGGGSGTPGPRLPAEGVQRPEPHLRDREQRLGVRPGREESTPTAMTPGGSYHQGRSGRRAL